MAKQEKPMFTLAPEAEEEYETITPEKVDELLKSDDIELIRLLAERTYINTGEVSRNPTKSELLEAMIKCTLTCRGYSKSQINGLVARALNELKTKKTGGAV